MAEVWRSEKGSGDRRSIASGAGRRGLGYRISEAPGGLRQSVEVGMVLCQPGGGDVGGFESITAAGYATELAHPDKRGLL